MNDRVGRKFAYGQEIRNFLGVPLTLLSLMSLTYISVKEYWLAITFIVDFSG